MIADVGAIGNQLAIPHALIEFLLVQTQHLLGLAESPAATTWG